MIKKEGLPFGPDQTGRRVVLADEIEDLEVACCSVAPSASLSSPGGHKRGRALLFLEGAAQIEEGDRIFATSGLAFYCPRHRERFIVRAGSEAVVYVELVVALDDEEDSALAQNPEGFYPFFVEYHKSPTYSERFKSEKTVSRTLLPHDRFPRLCVGSVETTGPDEVGAHAHPMLEQVFAGLPGNDCLVTADDSETRLGSLEALHIPLGSHHGARVESGRSLHYVWIDLFLRGEDMGWIKREHKPNE